MNKQQFISGQYFQLQGDDTVYRLEGTDMDDLSIVKYYLNKRNEITCRTYVCNVKAVGSKRFQGYTYIMGKRVAIEFYYSDLIPFTPTVVVD